jgi:hypothetical protein
VPTISQLIRAFERDRVLGAISLRDGLRAIKMDMAGLRFWCKAGPQPDRTKPDQ